MDDNPVAEDLDKSYFWTEGCSIFACALADRLRESGQAADIAVFSRSAGEPWSEDHEFEFTHVVVSVTDGYIDVNGFHDEPKEMMLRIGIDESISTEGDWSASIFKQLFMGNGDEFPLYGVTDETLALANKIIDADLEAFRLSGEREVANHLADHLRDLRAPRGAL